jgi:hypothetical protein
MNEQQILARLNSLERKSRWERRATVVLCAALLGTFLLGQAGIEAEKPSSSGSLCPDGARMVEVVLCHNGYDENDPIYSESWRRVSECDGGLRGPVDDQHTGYLCMKD